MNTDNYLDPADGCVRTIFFATRAVAVARTAAVQRLAATVDGARSSHALLISLTASGDSE